MKPTVVSTTQMKLYFCMDKNTILKTNSIHLSLCQLVNCEYKYFLKVFGKHLLNSRGSTNIYPRRIKPPLR